MQTKSKTMQSTHNSSKSTHKIAFYKTLKLAQKFAKEKRGRKIIELHDEYKLIGYLVGNF